MSLFDILEEKSKPKPLADKIRPGNFDKFVGQKAIIGEGSPIRKLLETNQPVSMILWGPPGCGKQHWQGLLLILLIANLKNYQQLRQV